MPRLNADARHRVRFTLNGRAVEADAEPRMLLTDFLRHVLGATGTHVGCEHGVCGACTVQIDGVPARACLTLAVQADGAQIHTVEGLAPAPGRLSVLQEAFRRHHALQCGFCTAGILMSLDAYLREKPDPQETELARLSRRALVPLHRLRADYRRGSRCRQTPARGRRRCLISAPALSAASNAIPNRLAIVDGPLRLTYAQWYGKISALVAGFDELGLGAGDHLLTVLQNRWEAATLHWACQFTGVIVTPVNWRATASEIDFFIENAQAKAIVYEDVSSKAVTQSDNAHKLPRIALGNPRAGEIACSALMDRQPRRTQARAPMPKPGRSCSTPPAPPRSRRACRGASAPNGPRHWRMSRKIFTRTASARSASCRSITPWACAHCSPCR